MEQANNYFGIFKMQTNLSFVNAFNMLRYLSFYLRRLWLVDMTRGLRGCYYWNKLVSLSRTKYFNTGEFIDWKSLISVQPAQLTCT